MSDLIDRLRAAIDETERLARRALTPPFVGMRVGAFTDPHESLPAQGEVVQVSILPLSWHEGPMAPVYIAFAPAGVLRRCVADRRILDEHDRICALYNDPNRTEPMPGGPAYGLWMAIVALAEGYGIEP